MPFDANGNFSLVPGTIVADGMNIQPSQHNPPFQDVANGLSQVVLRDGRAPWTGSQNANGHKLTGLSDGTSDSDAATVGQSADLVGDFKDSARTLNSKWLKRDGGIYNISDYPELGAILGPLPATVQWQNIPDSPPGIRSIADNGYMLVGVGESGSAYYSEDEGLTWSLASTGVSEHLNDVIYTPAGFIAVGDGGRVLLSPSGKSWATQSSGITSALHGAAYGSGVYVAVGESGVIIYSTALTGTWDLASSGATTTFRGVSFGLSRFLAAGPGGIVRSSVDGVSWSPAMLEISTDPTSLYKSIESVSFANDRFMIGASGVVWVSSDGITAVKSITSEAVFASVLGVDFGSGVYIAQTGSHLSYFSLDLSSWSSTEVGHGTNRGVHYFGGRFFVPSSTRISFGTPITAGQFRTPSDNPAYGWIRALS